MHRISVSVVWVAFMAALGGVVAAQSPPPPTSGAVLDELRQIRQLLERMAGGTSHPPADDNRRVRLSLAGAHTIGHSAAPITIVEFTDLQCPFCRQFSMTTFEQLKTAYIDTNTLRYVSRDFPLESIHPLAVRAARAARCAGLQGGYWEMRHAILRNNDVLTGNAVFGEIARTLKLDGSQFQACAENADSFRLEIAADVLAAEQAGITGTPSFVIGRTADTTIDGLLIIGAQPYEAFDARLKALLAEIAGK